jgi:hypothetical protein
MDDEFDARKGHDNLRAIKRRSNIFLQMPKPFPPSTQPTTTAVPTSQSTSLSFTFN